MATRRSALAAAAALVLLATGAGLMRTPWLNALLYFPSGPLEATPAEAGLRFDDVVFETEDGERLHAWWVPAAAQPALAHVLFCHGNAGNVSYRMGALVSLQRAGLDVFLFDYRGYGRSSGRPDEEGTYRDARAARRALLERPGVRPERLVYLGESLGGGVATALALESAPVALVLQSTFTSVRDMAALHYPFFPKAFVPDAYPTLRRIAGVRCPVLLIHGDRDDIAPVAHARTLLAAAPEPKRLEIVRGAGHNDLLLVAGQTYGELVADWIRAASR